MSERLAFIKACLDRSESIVAICDRFGISEKTGHKLLRRFRDEGPGGLADRSHAPHATPHRVSLEIEARLVEIRRRHPRYGAGKLRDYLVRTEPGTPWPAASTIGAVLTRHGLIRRRRRRHGIAERAALDGERTEATAPNRVWTADFKGQFRLGTRAYCYPLTVLDLHSHFLLGCTALASTAVGSARAIFVQLFRTYGLPEVLRTDNGVPFAQPNALGRLGAMAFWWVRLGIRPEHTTPATPSENGAHERFHRTLAEATVHTGVAPSHAAQQRRFDRFRVEYNTERPHQSLPNHCPPAQRYHADGAPHRPYPARLPVLCYPSGDEVRLVSSVGTIRWHSQMIFLSKSLAGQYVGLTTTEADLMTIAYGSLALGEFDPHLNRFAPRVRWLG